jgi:hypothetical protein
LLFLLLIFYLLIIFFLFLYLLFFSSSSFLSFLCQVCGHFKNIFCFLIDVVNIKFFTKYFLWYSIFNSVCVSLSFSFLLLKIGSHYKLAPNSWSFYLSFPSARITGRFHLILSSPCYSVLITIHFLLNSMLIYWLILWNFI